MTPPEPPKNGTRAPWSALRFAWELGYTIAIPLVLLALGGALIDRWLNTKPWFLLIGVVLSIGISTIGVFMKAVKVMAEFNRQTQPPKDKQSQDDKNAHHPGRRENR